MKSPARRFTLVMLAMSLLLVGGAVLLNYLIDPYNRFGNNRQGVYIQAERELKSTEVARYPHDALLVGNSRMAMIPPAGLKGFRFFNGAFPCATAEETFWFVHHHAHTQRLVVLGVDLGMQDPPVLQGDIFRTGNSEAVLANLLNLQTVEYSLKTVFSHWRGLPSHALPDGFFHIQGWMQWVTRADSATSHRHLGDLKLQWEYFTPPPAEKLSFYRKISETLRERGIACVAVVPPLHEEVVRHVGAEKLRSNARPWLAEMRTLFPHLIDLSVSEYGSAENYFPADPGHFKSEAGVRFMNEQVVPVATKIVAEQRK